MQQKFYPTPGQRVCSEHCDGRKKTYENNIPTIVPKIIEPNVFKEKKFRNNFWLVQKTINQKKIRVF